MDPFQHRLSFTKDRLYIYTVVFYFPKRSPFEGLFNVKLKEFQDAGILSNYIAKYDDHRPHIYQKSQSKLQMNGLLPPFEICAIMYLVSFIIFMLEVISTKCKRIKCSIDFLTY